jgi:DNA-binding Xre family transcriptional regulator/tetratricopeptide (TPR) repeat protein
MVTAEHLGDRLARLRRERMMTQEELAEQAGVSVDVVRKLEQHRKQGVRLETLHKLAHGLGTGSAALLGDPGAPPAAVPAPGDPVFPRRPVPESASATGDVDRRTLMGTVVGAAIVTRTAEVRRVDPALIPYFQQQLEGHYRADMLLGSRALIGTVTAQCDLIRQLADTAAGPTRQQMAKVGTSFATFAAWLHLDAGDVTTALRWHDVAQELAHRSHDREAVACALVDRAMARTDQGMGAAVVDLCEGALLDARHLSPELRVFALQQQAHGASLLRDRQQVDTLLDEAARLVGRVDVEVWGTACQRTPYYVEVQRATCYGRLGLADEADRAWQQIIPAAPASARRDVGVWKARQAVASAARGEPERAVELARTAAEIALETSSARAQRELAAVATAMAPWDAEPVSQHLAEVLESIGKEV